MDRFIPFARLCIAGSLAVLALNPASAGAQGDAPGSQLPSMSPVTDAGGLSVSGAWVREQPLAGTPAAAYLTIRNDTDQDDALVAISTPVATAAELHQSAMDDEGMMSMRPVDRIEVPAHGDAILAPAGYHVMLVDPLEPLLSGARVELTLTFAQAGSLVIEAPVLAQAPAGGDMGPGSMEAVPGMTGASGASASASPMDGDGTSMAREHGNKEPSPGPSGGQG